MGVLPFLACLVPLSLWLRGSRGSTWERKARCGRSGLLCLQHYNRISYRTSDIAEFRQRLCRICLNKYNPKANHSKREDATFKMHTAIDLHLRNDMKGAMGHTKCTMNGKRIISESKQPTSKDSTKIAQGWAKEMEFWVNKFSFIFPKFALGPCMGMW